MRKMMIVQCQACQTRFRVDESKIKGRGARMRCRRCGEAIIVMKDSPASPGSPSPKNLFDLRSVLKQPEPKPSRGFEESAPTPAAREPEEPPMPPETEAPAAWEPEEVPETGAATPAEEPPEAEAPAAWEPEREPPGIGSPEEVVSLRVAGEIPREAEPEEVPETGAVTPAEEPPEPPEAEAPAAREPEREPPDERDRFADREFPYGKEWKTEEEKPFELMLNDADSLDFLKEEHRRAETGGELDISGILRSDPSHEPEPAAPPSPVAPGPPPAEEPMPDRLEAIQRELQEIGGGSPEPGKIPSLSSADA
ncbi:MAG TPA: zinc-ribbon domain-containing protein, partial [Candidatus Deferrimicrobiaceae bacterium]